MEETAGGGQVGERATDWVGETVWMREWRERASERDTETGSERDGERERESERERERENHRLVPDPEIHSCQWEAGFHGNLWYSEWREKV